MRAQTDRKGFQDSLITVVQRAVDEIRDHNTIPGFHYTGWSEETCIIRHVMPIVNIEMRSLIMQAYLNSADLIHAAIMKNRDLNTHDLLAGLFDQTRDAMFEEVGGLVMALENLSNGKSAQ